MRKSLMQRLRLACAHMSPADFEGLVHKMTREQLRSESIRWPKARSS